MQFKLKAAAAAVVLSLSGEAGAVIINAQSGNGELMLYAWSDSAARTYVRDLGIQLNDFLYNGTVAPLGATNGGTLAFDPTAAVPIAAGNVTSSGYSLTFQPDQLMLDWIGNGSTLNNDVIWGIGANDGAGTGLSLKTLVTCSTASCEGVMESGLNSQAAQFEGAYDNLILVHNGKPSQANFLNGSSGTDATDSSSGNAATGMGLNWANQANFIAVQGALQPYTNPIDFFYYGPSSTFASSKPLSNPYANADGAFTWSLSPNGTIVYAAPTTVIPVPAAVWLMGSGLLGLVGIARRRKSVTA